MDYQIKKFLYPLWNQVIADLSFCPITDLELKHYFLAGGSIRDLFLERTPKDYDIYINSVDAFKAFKKGLTSVVNEPHISLEYVTANSTGVRIRGRLYDFIDLSKKKDDFNIAQFLDPKKEGAVHLLESFDFTINQVALNLSNIKLFQHSKTFFDDLLGKRLFLVTNRPRFGGEAAQLFKRTIKFLERGFIMPPEQREKLISLIHGDDLHSMLSNLATETSAY